MTFENVNISNWLKTWMWAHQKDTKWLANAMGVSDRTALRYYEGLGLTIESVRRLSKVTGTDLFVHYLALETQEVYIKGKALTEAEKKAAEKVSPEKDAVSDQKLQLLLEEMRRLREIVKGKLGEAEEDI